VPAREQLTRAVQHGNTASAVSTTGRAGTDPPGPVAAKPAGRPGDRDALLYGLPIGLVPASRAVHQNHGVRFSAHLDAAKWLCASESAIENWVKLGLFPGPRKVGGKRLWSRREVENHLAANKQLTASSPDELAERIKNGTRQAISRGEGN